MEYPYNIKTEKLNKAAFKKSLILINVHKDS